MIYRRIKLLIPKDRSEFIPFFLTIFLISIYFVFELSIVLPTIYHNIFTYKEVIHLIFGFYIIFNLIGNLYLCMVTDTSINTIICPFLLPSATIISTSIEKLQQNIIYHHCNWHYCYRCELNVPPRAEHCYLCKTCILKRDHHCLFLGRCIGFRNIRYYICFLIWCWVRKKKFGFIFF